MSIPINEFVFAGAWNATTSYPQFQFVQSPIDTLCYVNVNIQPSLGGADPSVQPSAYWVLLNQPSGSGITSLNGLVNPSMSLISSDTSVSINPIAPDKIDLTVAGTGFAPAYGSFSSTQIQQINPLFPTLTVLPITYDTADISPVGVNTTFGTADIKVGDAGVYKVLSSIQVDKTTGGLADIDMYPAVNGTAVPNSATRVNVNQLFVECLTVEWFLQLNAGDLVSINAYATTDGLSITAVPAIPPVPATPSILTTILRIA